MSYPLHGSRRSHASTSLAVRLRRHPAIALLALVILIPSVSCGGDSTAPLVPAALKGMGGHGQVGAAGATLPNPLVAQVSTAQGEPVPGVPVTWSVTSGGGSLSPTTGTTDADGQARATWTLGTVAGPNKAVARVDGMADLAYSATAEPGPAVSVVITPSDTTLAPSTTVTFTGAAADQYGNAIAQPGFAWSSSNEAVATIDGGGVATAHGGGTTTISAATGSIQAAAGLSVTTAPLAMETELVMLRATVDGSAELAATAGVPPYEWSLVAGTLPAGLELVSAGAITGTAAAPGSHELLLRVRDSAGEEADGDVTLEVCAAPLNLAVGESTVWSFPDRCGVVIGEQAGAAYRVGVTARDYQRTGGSTAVSINGGLRLLRTAGGTELGVASMRADLQSHDHGLDDAFDAETRALMRGTEAYHVELREQELRQFGDAPPHVLAPRDPQLELQATSYEPAQERIFFASSPAGGSSPRIQIPATLRATSASIIYYQDNSVEGTDDRATDAEIQAVLDYYESYGKPIIDQVFGGLGPEGTTNNFLGGPRLTNDIDGNGKFIVLQLSSNNIRDGAAAYVSSCDRYPRQENYNAGGYYCTGSNEAEMTYMRRPKGDFYRGTVVHETKHISSHGYALFGGRGFNQTWVEEGTAEIAKELSSRLAAGYDFNQELDFADLYPSGGTPPASTYGMALVHARARAFLRAAPDNALIGNPDPNVGGSTVYGSGWLFHRYLADAYAGGQLADFFLRMNRDGNGVEQIEESTGRSFGDLMAEFLVAIGVEGEPTGRQNAAHRFTSYDFADVASHFEGGPWPYSQWSGSFSSGSTSLSTFYTSTNFFDLENAAGVSQRLDLVRIDGMPLQDWIKGIVTITRVK
jgi:hypothetical protein